MMGEHITVRGFVATDWRKSNTDAGQAVASFRLASTERRLDRQSGNWFDGPTNWYTVSVFRALALNAAYCVEKGQPVLVTGKLHIRQWERDGRYGTSADIVADSIGHDLFWGTSKFTRTAAPPAAAGAHATAQAGGGGDADADAGADASADASRVNTEQGLVDATTGELDPFDSDKPDETDTSGASDTSDETDKSAGSDGFGDPAVEADDGPDETDDDEAA